MPFKTALTMGLALLSLSSLSYAAPLNTTTTLNTTLASHSINRHKAACSDFTGKDPLYQELCHCYNSGSRLDHTLLINGINTACQDFLATYPVGPYSEHKYQYAYVPYWYSPDSYHNQTFFLMKVEWVGDGMEQCVGWNNAGGYCEAALGLAVDGCNTDEKNGKQGGWVSTPCIALTLDTDPYTNNKEIAEKIAPLT